MVAAVAVPSFVVPVVAGLVAVLVVIVLLRLIIRTMWRVAEPNEALIISGRHEAGPKGTEESLGFRIITGKGAFVFPGLQVVRKLSLDLHKADLQIECVSQQGIQVTVIGVVIFKVGDDYASIANAARRFLGQENTMVQQVTNVFDGHLRSIVGHMTVEDLISDRERLRAEVREASGAEVQKLGLVVDSLQIKEIKDPTNYIENLAKPHIAAVQRAARIAQANNDREATQAEAEATALKAEAERDSLIRQAVARAEREKAEATAAQAGPLAAAEAKRAVVQQETQVTELEAARRERELDVEIRKPADAAAYSARMRAEGERDATILAAEAQAKQTKLVGEAEAQRIKQIGEAEGEALKSRSEGLASNQEAVIAQTLVEHWPEIVAAAAAPFSNIDNLTVLDGADGVAKAFATILTTGGTGLSTLRGALNMQGLASQNGHVPTDESKEAQNVS